MSFIGGQQETAHALGLDIGWVSLAPLKVPRRMRQIKALVAAYYGIPVVTLNSKRRARKYSHPRFIAYWLAREMTDCSYPEIGKAFGDRDHTTIMSGCRRVDDWIAQDDNRGFQAKEIRARML